MLLLGLLRRYVFFFSFLFCYLGKNLIILPTPAVAAEVGILLMTLFSFYPGK